MLWLDRQNISLQEAKQNGRIMIEQALQERIKVILLTPSRDKPSYTRGKDGSGYALGDSMLYRNPETVVSHNQAFDWFVTITGVKVEELGLCMSKGPEAASICGK